MKCLLIYQVAYQQAFCRKFMRKEKHDWIVSDSFQVKKMKEQISYLCLIKYTGV